MNYICIFVMLCCHSWASEMLAVLSPLKTYSFQSHIPCKHVHVHCIYNVYVYVLVSATCVCLYMFGMCVVLEEGALCSIFNTSRH